MEKDRSARLIAIVALVLAVTGVSIGFAVLSTSLNIKAPVANVKADDKLFTVYFSGIPSGYQAPVSVDPELSSREEVGFSGNKINVEANSTTLSGIGGTFTKPGQTITYAIGISNESKLDGYLTSIVFGDAESEKKVKCESVSSGNPIDQEELDKVCKDIKVTVKVNNSNEYNDTNNSLSGIPITNKSTIPLTVIIKYADDAVPATGDFKATFGDIVLGFSTKDNTGD